MRFGQVTLNTASGSHAIDVRLAVTPSEQQMGLKFLDHLPQNSGMLFLYRPAQEVSMWMKDTRLSLDIIFIRSDGAVHRIERRAEPLSDGVIPSRGPVAAVLEVAAGCADRLGLQAGDQCLIPHRP
jgi:uncharacterized membrane protein (UPF0127 family)